MTVKNPKAWGLENIFSTVSVLFPKRILECPHLLVSFFSKCNIHTEIGRSYKCNKLDKFHSQTKPPAPKNAFWFLRVF